MVISSHFTGITPINAGRLSEKVSQGDKFKEARRDAKLIARDLVAMPLATGLTMGLPPAVTAVGTAVDPVLGALCLLAGLTGLTSIPGLKLWNELGGDVSWGSFQGQCGLNLITGAIAGGATLAFGLKAGLGVSAAIGGIAVAAEAARAAGKL
ncbi:MAG: hypothetical protein HYU64_10870 [Armatimonadetes bacterium]|nr:hypothetical protein [Armatimonadota bacterium]